MTVETEKSVRQDRTRRVWWYGLDVLRRTMSVGGKAPSKDELKAEYLRRLTSEDYEKKADGQGGWLIGEYQGEFEDVTVSVAKKSKQGKTHKAMSVSDLNQVSSQFDEFVDMESGARMASISASASSRDLVEVPSDIVMNQVPVEDTMSIYIYSHNTEIIQN